MRTLAQRSRAAVSLLGIIASLVVPSTGVAQGRGIIRGTVADSITGEAIQSATISVAGTSLGAVTANDGSYIIRGVAAGPQSLRVARIGYAPQPRSVTVTATGEAIANFKLLRSAVQLDEVVTTVTGAQRKAELGHSISQIKAEELIKQTPVFNISDMLTSRVPSAMVDASSGLTGQVMKIRIRGLNSFTLTNDPLVIVDGARIEASTGTAGRLGDLNMNEVEAIEVVKGPAAATLYGTDAANGVVVIRTKRGQAGRTRWEVLGEIGTLHEDTAQFPNTMYSWGHSTAGKVLQCPLYLIAQGACVQDSISHYNPLKDPAATAVGLGHRNQQNLQAAGGVAQFRYFVSGGWERELGWMKMPNNEETRLKQERGVTSLPDEQIHPNYLSKINIRGNLTTDVGKKADLALSNGFVYQDFRNTSTEAIRAGYWSPGFKDDAYAGYSFNSRIGDYLSVRDAQAVTRYVSSLSGNYRPLDWLTGRSTLGLDFSHNLIDRLQRNGEGPPGTNRTGNRTQAENTIAQYSLDAGATATAPLTFGLTGLRRASLVSKTSIGAQYNRRNRIQTQIQGTGLPPGSEVVTGAATLTGLETHEIAVVFGSFAEEQLSWRDKVFVTGAVRFDGASTFGKNLNTTAYPKYSVSWLASQESFFPHIPGLSSLRFRAAVGSSGVQPPSTAGLSTVNLVTASINNAAVSAVQRGAIGNIDVRPERQTEKEVGLDLELLGGRVRAEATYYDKLSTDALVQVPFPSSVGGGNRYGNIGSVSNKGVEGSVDVRVFELSKAAFDVTVAGSVFHNNLVSVGPDAPPGFFANYSFIGARHRVGYPLYGGWQRPVLEINDRNADRIVAQDELVVGDTEVYIGPTSPTRQLTVTPQLTLGRDRIRIFALFDYRGGFMRNDYTWFVGCVLIFNCPGAVDRNTSLKEQADVQAYLKNNTNYGYWSDGAFTRLRELTMSIRLPDRVVFKSGAQSGTLTFGGRNLWFWSKWTGGDPEVGGGTDLEYTFPTPPLARYLIARINLSY